MVFLVYPKWSLTDNKYISYAYWSLVDIIIGSRARFFCGHFNMNAGDDENILNDTYAYEDLINTVKRKLGRNNATYETLDSLD